MQHKKVMISGSPRILGSHRKAIKFAMKVATDFLRANDLLGMLLEGDLFGVEST